MLLVERQNTWYENGMYLAPGGIVDENETPVTAAVREVFEETGLVVSKDSLSLIHHYQNELNGRSFDNYYFISRTCSGEAVNKEPARHSAIGWFPLSNLPKNTSEIVYDVLNKL